MLLNVSHKLCVQKLLAGAGLMVGCFIFNSTLIPRAFVAPYWQAQVVEDRTDRGSQLMAALEALIQVSVGTADGLARAI
jgi:hypothetical protein